MNEPTLGRLLGLVEKTGDKVIVTDPAGDRPYVLMSLDQYERLLETAAGLPTEKVAPKAEMPRVEKTASITQQMPFAQPPVRQNNAQPKPQNQVRGFAKPADVWRSKLGLEAAEPPARDLFSRPKTQNAKVLAETSQEFGIEVDGEEQFYLEPLE